VALRRRWARRRDRGFTLLLESVADASVTSRETSAPRRRGVALRLARRVVFMDDRSLIHAGRSTGIMAIQTAP
jgi:hypothetical protein